MNDIRGWIFDMDDTLYCEHDYVRSGLRAVANVLQQNCALDESFIYKVLIDEWKVSNRRRIFNVVCEKYGWPADIPALVQVYREHQPVGISLYPDADRLLKLLEERNVLRAIITDGDKTMQWQKIKALLLRERVPCIIVSDDLGNECWKPSPATYLQATKRLGLKPENCVYIGDNPQKDFVTARRLGMHTIRIVRDIGDHMRDIVELEYEAEKTVYSLDELSRNLGLKNKKK